MRIEGAQGGDLRRVVRIHGGDDRALIGVGRLIAAAHGRRHGTIRGRFSRGRGAEIGDKKHRSDAQYKQQHRPANRQRAHHRTPARSPHRR